MSKDIVDPVLAKKLEAENDTSKMVYEDPHPLITFFAKKGMPVDEFSKMVGYSPAYFQLVLLRWKRPGTKLALQIEEKTGMSVSYLLRIPLKNSY